MEFENHYSEILRQVVSEIRTARHAIARKLNAAAMGVIGI
jgi:hypothetical protein